LAINSRPINGGKMSEIRFAEAMVCFDVFQVDLRARELRREGRRVKLQEQPCRVLFLLLERAGEVVTREELREKLWPADTFVDFDHGLNSAVARLREALCDSAEEPRFIETISKRGYRFIAPFQPANSPVAVSSLSRAAQNSTRLRSLARAGVWIGSTLCLALLSALTLWALYRPNSDSQLERIEVVPLIGLRGLQATPAFSPDGTLVAFRQSDGAHNTGIFAAVVGGQKSLQLTTDPGDCCPTWSPDGRQLAFIRYAEKDASIFTIAALGGTEHRVYHGPSLRAGLTWSPNGDRLVFSETNPADTTRSVISLLSLSDSSTQALTSPPAGWLDHEPAFSPDGSQVAFIRSTIAGVSNDVFVMPAAGGQAKRLTFDNRPIMGPPAWTPDSREIIFSSDRGVETGLWRVSAKGCIPRPVAGPVGEATWPSIPATGNSLVYEQGQSKFNIWRLELKDADRSARPPSPLISEKGDKMRPELSPDGKKIAFESNRLGFWDIWTCDVEGNNCDQVTSLHGTAGRARWSPNGRYIAFEFHPKERSEIYVAEVPGGLPHLLPTIAGADNLSPSWSRDGRWIYFASKRGTEPFQIWKMPVQGGSPSRITSNGGISPVESPDGRFLYYSKYEQDGIWRIPLQGGQETEVVSDIEGGGWPNWGVSADGIYFLRFRKFPLVTIDFFEFATGKTIPIWSLEKEPGWGLSLSHDGKSIVYIQNEFLESNLMLVKNFR
jgi:Tol biopolymer transport system component/DNA-binding winged helix-turn-helix (wHTH) protein